MLNSLFCFLVKNKWFTGYPELLLFFFYAYFMPILYELTVFEGDRNLGGLFHSLA